MLLFLLLFLGIPIASSSCDFLNTRLASLAQTDNLAHHLTTIPSSVNATLSGALRNDAIFNSRQMIQIGGTNFNSVWPVQSETDSPLNVFREDIFDRPTASIVNILPSVNTSLSGVKIGTATADLFMSITFIGFNFGNGVALLNNIFAQLAWEHNSVAFGKMNHPFMIPYCFPDVVSNGFGAPITPYALAPQIRYQHRAGNLNFSLVLFNQYLTSDNGPLAFPFNFLNLYIRNSLVPAINTGLEFANDDYTFGMKINFKRLRPRLYTQPAPLSDQTRALATGETITSMTYCAYSTFEFKNIYIASQYIFGDDGTSWVNLGGYAVSSINPTNDVRTYTNISYESFWTDIVLLNSFKNLRPGIYIGFTKNTGTKKPIAFDGSTGLPLAYTIDDFALFSQEIFDFTPKRLMSLMRIAPRLWIYFTRNLLLGLEWTYFRTEYAHVNQFYKPIDPHVTHSWQGVASTQYLF